MKDFGEWFANPTPNAKPAPTKPDGTPELPDGLRIRYECKCCVCGKWREWFGDDPEDFKDGVNNYCGGSPSCCP